MTLANVETGEIVSQLSAEDARELTDRIKVGVEAVWHLVTQAYQAGAHRALGYLSWDDYCTREFGTSRIRLPREERQEVVASLRDAGLSTRAIGSALGVNHTTVQKDLQAGGGNPPPDRAPLDRGEVTPNFKQSMTPKEAKPVTGTDGKTYPAKSTEDPVKKAQRSTARQRSIDIRQLTERGNNAQQIATELNVGVEYVRRVAKDFSITLVDEVIGKSRKLDPNRIVGETVDALAGAAFGLDLVKYEDLDPDELEGWVISLGDSLKSLNSLHRKLKEMTR